MGNLKVAVLALCLSVVLAGAASAQELACVDDAGTPCARDAGLIRGPNGAMQAEFEWVEGNAVFEGDIVVEVLDRSSADVTIDSAIIDGPYPTWPNGVIPYAFDPSLSSVVRSQVQQAINHWNSRTSATGVTVVPRTTQADYVVFRPESGCWSYLGRWGGAQTIGLAENCGVGAAIHEIAHAAGAWHEQSRHDRDAYVTILWGNIAAGKEYNFQTYPAGHGVDHGPYDYGSIMHYPRWGFSINGFDTIVPTQSGVVIGQRRGLSTGDVNGIAALYGGDGAGGGGGTASPLENGVPVAGLAGAALSEQHFVLNVPAGVVSLSFETSGGPGDADLYVSRGAQPTTSSYDCKSSSGTAEERCAFEAPQAGDWYVMIHGYSDFSGVRLIGDFDQDGEPPFSGTSKFRASAAGVGKFAWEGFSELEIENGHFRYAGPEGIVLSGSSSDKKGKLVLSLDEASLAALEGQIAQLVSDRMATKFGSVPAWVDVGIDSTKVTFTAKQKIGRKGKPGSMNATLSLQAWVDTSYGSSKAKLSADMRLVEN